MVLLKRLCTEACSNLRIKEQLQCFFERQKITIRALHNGVEVNPGDTVEIEMSDMSAIKYP